MNGVPEEENAVKVVLDEATDFLGLKEVVFIGTGVKGEGNFEL